MKRYIFILFALFACTQMGIANNEADSKVEQTTQTSSAPYIRVSGNFEVSGLIDCFLENKPEGTGFTWYITSNMGWECATQQEDWALFIHNGNGQYKGVVGFVWVEYYDTNGSLQRILYEFTMQS